MTQAIQKNIAALRSGIVTRKEVIGLRKLFNAAMRSSRYRSRTEPRYTPDQLAEVSRLLSSVGPVVTGELHDTGLTVLRNPRYKKRLADVADIVAQITRFELVRFEPIGDTSLGVVPVFRACSPIGSLLFRNIPWQSHGNGPEVLHISRAEAPAARALHEALSRPADYDPTCILCETGEEPGHEH